MKIGNTWVPISQISCRGNTVHSPAFGPQDVSSAQMSTILTRVEAYEQGMIKSFTALGAAPPGKTGKANKAPSKANKAGQTASGGSGGSGTTS